MKQLAAITQFIVGLNMVAAEQIDTWVENPKVEPAGTVKSNNDSVVIYRQTYDAVIAIERYAHRVHPPELLFAQICAWLIEHDGDRFDRKDADLITDVDIMDDQTADIEITIDFHEEVEIVEYAGGPIELAGKRYQLRDLVLRYAEEGEVTT